MKISILIPAFNEQDTIAKVIKRVKELKLEKDIKKEIIVIDDASSDNTPKILKKTKDVVVLTHKQNQGKGSAVSSGVQKANGDVLVIQDADLEYDPKYIPILLKTMIDKNAQVVYGSRLKHYPLRLIGAKRTPLVLHYLGNKFLTLITQILFHTRITDMETGYKMFKKSVLNDIEIKSKRFDLEPEITAKILKKGINIYEIPIKTTPRGYDEGKKITWKDGFRAIWTLFKYKFID